MSYYKDLVTDILPYISRRIPELLPQAQQGIWELTNTYVHKSKHGDVAFDWVTDLQTKLSDPSLFSAEEEKTESEEHVYSLFVLASTYFLGYFGLLKQSDIRVDKSGELGFDGSFELFYETLEAFGLVDTNVVTSEDYFDEEEEYEEDLFEDDDYEEDLFEEEDYEEEEWGEDDFE